MYVHIYECTYVCTVSTLRHFGDDDQDDVDDGNDDYDDDDDDDNGDEDCGDDV